MNPIYSLDGNSIYDVALKFERLGIQEMNKNPEFSFQGVNIGDSNKDGIQFKNDFDKLFSLAKEFYVKIIKGTQGLNDNIEAEIEDAVKRLLSDTEKEISSSLSSTSKAFIVKFDEESTNEQEGLDYIEMINSRIDLILGKSTDGFAEKHLRLKRVVRPSIDIVGPWLNMLWFDLDLIDTDFHNLSLVLEDKYLQAMEQTYEGMKLQLKSSMEFKSKIDVRSALRLTRFEGTASNVLRDIILTSNSMVQDVNNKRVLLQESLKLDDRLTRSIKYDNSLIMNEYVKELKNHPEVKANYQEPFNKAQANLMKLNIFVNEL
jgi:hypothetical protein